MMKHAQLTGLLKDLAEAEVPARGIDLVPSVAAQYRQRQLAHSVFLRTRKAAFGVAVALIALALLLMLVPTTRAMMTDFLQRLGLELASEEETRNTTVVLMEPIFAEVTPTPVSLEELRAQVPFAVPEPTSFPVAMIFEMGHVSPIYDGIQVTLYYRRADSPPSPDSPHLLLDISNGDLGRYYLSAEAAQDVVVRGQPGIYIHGSWTTEDPIQPGESTTGLIWDYAEDAAYLVWEEQGLAYRIQAYDLGFDLNSLIGIAESLR